MLLIVSRLIINIRKKIIFKICLQSETIRQLSKVKKKLENPSEEFKYWLKNVKKYSPNCPHHKPVMHEITSL